MLTTRIYLDSRYSDAEGASPLKFCMIRQGKAAYIKLDVKLLPSQWNRKEQKVVDHPNKRFLNSYIEGRKTEIDNIIKDLIIKGKIKDKTITQIKNIVVSILDPEVKSSDLFIPRFTEYMNRCKAERTKAIYKATLDHILKYDSKAKTRGFEDISKSWLEGFDTYLSKTSPSKNARNIHFRNIRAVFNAAIDDNLISCYPFRNFKLKDEETRKRNLTKEQLQKIMNYKGEDYERKYIDCFLLSFYLSGINGVDLLNATPEQVVNGRLEYKRSKTGKLMSVKIEPEAQEIIDRYKGTTRLLKWGERLKSYKSFMMKVNQTMNGIIPGCTAYYARHTIASLAAELDIPNETIAQILGHHDDIHRTTMIYINPEQSKADKACRRIFDYIKE